MNSVSPSIQKALQVCDATAAHFHVMLLNGALKEQLRLYPRADVRPIIKEINKAIKQFTSHPPAIANALRSNLSATKDQLNTAKARIFNPGDDQTLPPDGGGGPIDTTPVPGVPEPPPPPTDPDPVNLDPAAPIRDAAALFGPESFPTQVPRFEDLSPEDQDAGRNGFESGTAQDIEEYLKNLADYLQVYPEWPPFDIVNAIVGIVIGAGSGLGSLFEKVQAFATITIPRMLAEVEEQLTQ